jgi:hypothetical protein
VSVEDRLRHAAPPDAAGAHDRARRVVLEAMPVAARRRRRVPVLVALAVLAGGLALTPPGDALARWLKGLVEQEPAPPAVQLGPLPAVGRLLATGPSGAYVVSAAGRRRLGAYEGGAWSPHGRFIAVTAGNVLRAVDPGGAVRWTLEATGPVTDPRWSPTGYRIAYRRDDDLRVVAGDGSGDHPLVDTVAAVPAAWRPGSANEVAVARGDGAVELWAADTGRRLWQRQAGDVRDVEWLPDGELLVVTSNRIAVLAAESGRVRWRSLLAPGVVGAALAPDGSRLALAWDGAVATVRVRPRARVRVQLRAAPVESLIWTADRIAVASRDRWYFVPTAGGPVTAVAVRGLTRVDGWCCA